MQTKLVEFIAKEGHNLRGIITIPDGEIKNGVICIHGFERCTTTEKKFKKFSDLCAPYNIATLRFDFSGCGLSDGDFSKTTLERQSDELQRAIDFFQNEINITTLDVIAHSLGACILANQLPANQRNKMILIAPALNQKELLRYRFVSAQMKKKDPLLEITRANYQQHLDEEAFIVDCKRTDKTTKTSFISSDYFLQNKDINFSSAFDPYQKNVLHVHGDKDITVPLQSLSMQFSKQIIVEQGDHDLEKPASIEQWTQEGINFLIK